MKKAILVQNRTGKDAQGNSCLWLTMYQLPSLFTRKDGAKDTWYPKKDDAVIITCVSQANQPHDYDRLKDVREGAICGVHFAVNDFTNKVSVGTVDVMNFSHVYSAEELYVIPKE